MGRYCSTTHGGGPSSNENEFTCVKEYKLFTGVASAILESAGGPIHFRLPSVTQSASELSSALFKLLYGFQLEATMATDLLLAFNSPLSLSCLKYRSTTLVRILFALGRPMFCWTGTLPLLSSLVRARSMDR